MGCVEKLAVAMMDAVMILLSIALIESVRKKQLIAIALLLVRFLITIVVSYRPHHNMTLLSHAMTTVTPKLKLQHKVSLSATPLLR